MFTSLLWYNEDIPSVSPYCFVEGKAPPTHTVPCGGRGLQGGRDGQVNLKCGVLGGGNPTYQETWPRTPLHSQALHQPVPWARQLTSLSLFPPP
jgi:hypothetical protein